MTAPNDLATPGLLLDLERVRANAARVGQRVRELGARLRPHVKTHKCVEVARLQTAGHSGAITVSTLAEARAFSAHGFSDITYAVPIEKGRFAQAIDLVARGVRLALITDDRGVPPALDAAARSAGVTIDLFLKVDCGYHRCGVAPESAEALDIPRSIAVARHLRFAGILTHAGHSYHCRSLEERRAVARAEREVMVELAARLRADGLTVPVVSVGSTPSVTAAESLQGVDEARPGNYVLFDAFQAALGSCSLADCALTVLAAVTHRSRARRQVILDAGSLALSKDRGAVDLDPGCGYGRLLDLEGRNLGLRLSSLSQEHGVVPVDDDALLDRLEVGARVRVVPNHACLVSAQHAWFHVLEDGRIVDRWAIHRGW